MESFTCKRCNTEARDGAQCSVCHGRFDFPCSGITESGYRKLGDRKSTWKCPSCKGTASPSVVHGKPGSAKSPVLTDIDNIALDIKRLATQMSALPALMSSIKAIQTDIADLRSVKTDMADLKLLKPELEAVKVSILQQRFQQLESSLHDFDQRSRMNNIEIKGVPVSSTEKLFEIVAKIGRHIGCPIPKEQINYIARIPIRNDKHSKNILLSVQNRYIKEDFVAASKKYSITPTDLGIQGDTRIFINDHLTRQNKMLLTKAKSLARERGFAYVWVKGCKIFVRKSPTSHALNIISEADLRKIA
ncbi:hypothetical protein ACJJTC_014855 [Scirpophaga incertulas]